VRPAARAPPRACARPSRPPHTTSSTALRGAHADLMLVTMRCYHHLSDLYVVDYRNRSNAGNNFNEPSAAALPCRKRHLHVICGEIVYSFARQCSGQDAVLGRALPTSKLALASGEIPLIGSPISTSKPRITQIPRVPVRACICPGRKQGKADKRDGRPMMSYRDQPDKHTGHVRAHLRACAAARQVGA
jgi:hypothetical protein